MRISCVILALLGLVWPAMAGSCAPEFAEMCRCGYVPVTPGKQLRYVTNCTNAGFDNTMMLRKLSADTEILIFVGNEVRDLPINIFGQEITFDKLHTIDLSNNHIQSIKGRTFHNVANVTKLFLNHNDLYIISKDHHPRMFSNFVHLKELHLKNAFTEKVKADNYLNNLGQIFGNSSLTHLQVLNLEDNEIPAIEYQEFCSLPALQRLYLSGNRLRDLNLNFNCLKNLKELDAGNNLIHFLSDQTLRSFRAIGQLKLNLTANPFKCDCNMVSTYDWVFNTSIKLVNSAYFYCWDGYPPIIGKPLSAVHRSDLQCPAHSHASFILLSIGFMCLIAVVSLIVYKNRATIGLFFRRTIRSQFHYVSLNRRETTMEV